MEDTVDSAMRSVKPAVLRAGSGQSLINVDRKQWYFFEENGQPVSVLSLGSNRNTQIDHTVTVLRFDYEDGCPAAFFLNYPVHCSVMHGNSCCDGKMGISPDIAGSVSSALESKYPGSVALLDKRCCGRYQSYPADRTVLSGPYDRKAACGTDPWRYDAAAPVHGRNACFRYRKSDFRNERQS